MLIGAISALPIAALAQAAPGDFNTDFINTVPEPETLALMGIGAIAWLVARWARRK